MNRKIVLSSLALVAPIGLVALATPGATASAARVQAHSKKPVTFTGKMQCNIQGTIALSPAFTTSGTSSVKSASFTLTGKLTKCGGSKGYTKKGVTITGGAITAKGTVKSSSGDANSCEAVVSSSSVPPISGTATFHTKNGSATPTKFHFSAGSFTALSSPIVVTYPAKGGTAKATGSFAGTKGSAVADVKQTALDLLNSCGSSSGLTSIGLSKGTATFG